MSLTIGRLGVATADGGDGATLDTLGTAKATQDGRQVTVEGWVTDTTRAGMLWLSKQIIALAASPDEPVVPVTISTAPELDGYYRVLASSADTPVVGTTTVAGAVHWTVQLEQVTDWRAPRIEYPSVRGRLTNAHSITTYDVSLGVSTRLISYYQDVTGTAPTTRTVGDTGTVNIYTADGLSTAGPTQTVQFLTIDPGDYYHGGCRVEHDISTATYRTAVGRQSFPEAGNVRISNGLVRAEWAAATSSTLAVDWFDGSGWVSTNFTFSGDAAGHGTVTATTATILRNTPEEAVVRFTCTPSNAITLYPQVTLDLHVRRGSRWLTVYWQSIVGGYPQVAFTTPTATTALTGGIRRTANNANGDREILLTPEALTADNTNGSIHTTFGVPAALLGVGLELNGSGSSGRDTVLNQRDEWFGVYTERGIVVAV